MMWLLLSKVMDQRLRQLAVLLPGTGSKLWAVKSRMLAVMLADTRALALKLVALREIFPRADIAQVRLKVYVASGIADVIPRLQCCILQLYRCAAFLGEADIHNPVR